MAVNLQGVVAGLKAENEIIFGINPFTSPENIKRMYVPILNWVCSHAGYKARITIVKDYEALTEGIKQNIIDVGWLSPFAYVHAHRESGVMPIVTPKVNGLDPDKLFGRISFMGSHDNLTSESLMIYNDIIKQSSINVE